MPKHKSPEDFFKKARENGSEKNKDTLVTGEEVKKTLQPHTLKRYRRMLAMWNQYKLDQFKLKHLTVTPYDIKTLQDFTTDIAYGIEGAFGDPVACMSTVVTYLKDFSGGLRDSGLPELGKQLTTSTRNFIQGPLLEMLKMARRKRERRYGAMIHFKHLGTQLWRCDWNVYSKPGIRIDLWGEIQANVFSSSRVGEYIESTCRPGSGRGLYYRDVKFGLFRNENGDPEFAIQLMRDAKGMTNTPHKRPQHSLHEGLVPTPLFWNPILTYLAIFVSKGAFRMYKTMEVLLDLEPLLDDEMYQLEWDPNILDVPFFQRSTGEVDTAGVHSRRLRDLGLRSSYAVPPTIHDFRAEGFQLVDKLYSSTQRMKYGGHTDENTYRDHYAPNDAGVDGQSAYFGAPIRSLPSDLFRGLTVSRNPELWQSLPAEEQDELENSPEFKAIEDELENLSLSSKDDLATKNRRKELQAQKRKLVTEKLRECQKHQPKGLPSKNGESDSTGHHRTLFSRARALMPERDRLANNMFVIAPIRSDMGRAVLRDLITLYQQDTEVACRPGLEPERCFCPMTDRKRKIHSKPASQRWRHIYSCHKKHLTARNGFAELCFFCSEWVVGNQAWENHCQAHLDGCKPLPVQCNPFTYGGALASVGTCPFCRGDTALPAAERMQPFPDLAPWREHLSGHLATLEKQSPDDSKSLRCPDVSLPQCEDAFKSVQEVKFHLQNVHCGEFIKASKRSKPADDVGARPRNCKMGRTTFKQHPDVSIGECTTHVYEFVDQTAEHGNQKRHRTSTPSTHRSKSISTAPSTAPSTPPLVDSGSSTPLTEWAGDESESETYMPVQPSCSDMFENIDPSLFSQSAIPPIGDNAIVSSPRQSFSTGLSRSSSHGACTIASDYDVIEIEDLTNLHQEKPQALEPGDSPTDFATAPRAFIPPTDDTDWFDLSIIRDTLLMERPAADSTDILTYEDIAVEQGRNYPDEDFVIVGDSLNPDPRNTLDSEELLDSRVSEANSRLGNDSTRGIPTSRQDPEYPLLSGQDVQISKPSAVVLKHNEFIVERVIDDRVVPIGRGRRKKMVTQYWVKWAGYPEDQNSWVNEADLSDDHIEPYLAGKSSP